MTSQLHKNRVGVTLTAADSVLESNVFGFFKGNQQIYSQRYTLTGHFVKNLFKCLLIQISILGLVDTVKTEVQTEHHNDKDGGIKNIKQVIVDFLFLHMFIFHTGLVITNSLFIFVRRKMFCKIDCFLCTEWDCIQFCCTFG